MKRVLLIAPYKYLPYETGGQKLIGQFTEELGKQCQLFVISTRSNDASKAQHYELIKCLNPSFFRYLDISLVKRIIDVIKIEKIDFIIWEHPYYAWLAWIIKKLTGIKTIFHTHNIEFQRFKSMGKWWWPILKLYEKFCFTLADKICFITDADAGFAIDNWKISNEKCYSLPFGVEIEKYPLDKKEAATTIREKYKIASQDRLLLFNGALDYAPNSEALEVILNKINPLLINSGIAYKIIICGKGLSPALNELKEYKEKNIVYAGFVPDIETYFKAADILLNPVQSGGGIKTKMIEAIAFGASVVATKTAATGLNPSICNEKLMIVNDSDWESFAKTVIENNTYNNNTPIEFYNEYNWAKIVQRFLNNNLIK